MQLLNFGRPRNRVQLLIIFMTVCGALMAAVLVWARRETETLADPPGAIRDAVFYDNMAYNLSQGRGFIFDFQNEKWRDRYRRVNQNPQFKGKLSWVLNQNMQGPTTTRPPGYPVFLAVIYRTCGWRWDAARLIGGAFACLGLAAVVTWSWNRWGAVAAIISTFTLMLDYSVMTYSAFILTEPVAIGLVGIWFVLLVRGFEKPSIGLWMLCGLILALLIHLRGNWTLWLLFMLAASSLLMSARVRKLLLPVTATQLLTFLAIAFLLSLPWWVRNCLVSSHFQPLGTAGSRGLVAAYCDESLADHGNWQTQVYTGHAHAVAQEVDRSQLTLPEWEYEVARRSTTKAMDWVAQHWPSLPRLAVERLLSHLGLYQPLPMFLYWANVWLLSLATVGLFLTGGRVRQILLMMLFLDFVVVTMTWAHGGRFGIPMRPLVHICYGLAATVWLDWMIARLKGKGHS